MSMLSAQCDELRSMAESVGLEVPQAATLMMEAADTIWELRDSVYRERAEADRLREQCRDMLKTIRVMDEEWHSLTDFTTMAEAAETYDFEAENAPEYEEKLRELGVEVN